MWVYRVAALLPTWTFRVPPLDHIAWSHNIDHQESFVNCDRTGSIVPTSEMAANRESTEASARRLETSSNWRMERPEPSSRNTQLWTPSVSPPSVTSPSVPSVNFQREQQVRIYRAEVERLSAELTGANGFNRQVVRERNDLRNEVAFWKETAETISTWEPGVLERQRKINQLEHANTRLEQKNSELKQENRELRVSYSQHRKALEDAQDAEQERKRLLAELCQRQQTIEQTLDENRRMSTQLSVLNNQLSSLQRECNTVTSERQIAQVDNIKMVYENDDLKAQVDQLKTEIRQFKEAYMPEEWDQEVSLTDLARVTLG
ncbi:hypothetical protein OHC33_000987 [Knufia fluminis]|uniref:Uncharacterized protein n=1 Tax=Knufia fluminis TaxID=191047 RepID=A0AAN8EL49_9EURO|nr:hypothetical protein OHC33_000987 [Knufia fluminis]